MLEEVEGYPTKNCDACNFSKNCEKLDKSLFLLKLIKSSVREGRRVPNKNCDFCNFSKNCEKLEKSKFLLKLIKSGVRGGRRLPSKNCDFWNFSKNSEKLDKSQFLLKLIKSRAGFCQWGIREIVVTLWFNLASSIHCGLILTNPIRIPVSIKNFALKISSLAL